QRSWMQGDALASLLAWWRESLAGLEPLHLPADRPRSADRSQAGAAELMELPAELTGRLSTLALRSGSTLFMVMLAAWMALFRRTSGQSDVAVGSPIAGRNRQEIEPLIGFFINMLVLRGDLSGDPGFAAL